MERRVYRDFDAFADAVGDVDAVMMLQNPQRRIWSLDRADLAGVHVQCGRLGSGNIVEGQSWSHGYLVYLPLSNVCEYSANGTAFGPGSFMVLEPSSEFCISTKDEHDWCSIFVPTHALARGGGPVEPSPRADKGLCRVSHPSLEVANRFASLVRNTTVAASACANFESSFAARRAAAEALRVVASVVSEPKAPDGARQQGRPKKPRREIAHLATDMLDARDGEPVLVSELAAAAGVSERTLGTAFKEYFGISPRAYLQLRRLHAVHRALRAADPGEESVTDVLVRHGEWEWGRFAKHYRRLFGELPSETLRRLRSGKKATPAALTAPLPHP